MNFSYPELGVNFSKDSIESAYCFFHQKLRVYEFSHRHTQCDNIEYAISQYVDGMTPALYQLLANGTPYYLLDHTAFEQDMHHAIELLDGMM